MSYYTELILDFGLSADQLRDRYDRDCNENSGHPVFTGWEWRTHVAIGSTRSGYWEWVRSKLRDAEDELDRDNPYNQWMKEN